MTTISPPLTALLLLVCATLPASAAAPQPGFVTSGLVVDCIDGDTVEVLVSYRVRVRLLDCWAPETRTKDQAEKTRGLRAKEELEDIALGKECTLHIPADGAKSLADITTLGRVLGYVWVDGKSLSELQVASGNATREKRRQTK